MGIVEQSTERAPEEVIDSGDVVIKGVFVVKETDVTPVTSVYSSVESGETAKI